MENTFEGSLLLKKVEFHVIFSTKSLKINYSGGRGVCPHYQWGNIHRFQKLGKRKLLEGIK
jgi:hypothetical protein